MKDTTKAALESLGMDLQQTLGRFVGNEGLLFKFLGKFKSDASYTQLADAMEQNDLEMAFHAAHTLKGVVGNLGLGTLFDTTSDVVELLRTQDMPSAQEQFPAVRDAYENVKQTLSLIDEIP